MSEKDIRKGLILEHAKLAAQYSAGETDCRDRLFQIEEELGMTAEAIASEAIRIYEKTYQ